MRLREVILLWYRSVDFVNFEVKPFTVLFGANNSGKTNVLEAIYGVLSPAELDDEDADHPTPPGLRGGGPPYGALIVELEAGAPIDDGILTFRRSVSEPADGVPLPASHAALMSDYSTVWWTVNDPREYFRQIDYDTYQSYPDDRHESLRAALMATSPDADLPLPIFLDWEIDNIEARVADSIIEYLSPPVFLGAPALLKVSPREPGTPDSWQINPSWQEFFDKFADLATRLLPDFLDGSIQANIRMATMWNDRLRVTLRYRDREYGSTQISRFRHGWLLIRMSLFAARKIKFI